MSERVLRGTRLGAASYETDDAVEVAERRWIPYDCPHGHHFSLPLSVEAEVPAVWECRYCGAEALRVDADRPEPKRVKPARTHWDMLLERRTIADLEEVLAERLAVLRARGGVEAAEPSGPSRRKSA